MSVPRSQIGIRRVSGDSDGFTLVELLVIIGIVTLLISLLLPVVSAARGAANRIKCSANLRSIGQAMMMHATDHRGYFPLAGTLFPSPAGFGSANPSGLADVNKQKYDYFDNGGGQLIVTALPASLCPYLLGIPFSVSNGFANVNAAMQQVGALQNIFLCPSDEATINRTYAAPRWFYEGNNGWALNGWSSFGWNDEVLGYCDIGVGGLVAHNRLRGNVVRVPHPTETILFADGYNQMYVGTAPLTLGDVYLGPATQYMGVSGRTGNSSAGTGAFDLFRHRGSMNILYVDGHVDNQSILSTGSMNAVGSVGAVGNSPSGALMKISMDLDFP